MSRQELEAMFGIDDLKKTRFAQELIAESKAEKQNSIFKLLRNSFGSGTL